MSDDDLHFKADGSLDMRYTSSQDYYEEHGTIWVESSNDDNSYHNTTTTTYDDNNDDNNDDDLHFKADGSLDMRYTSSQEYYEEHGTMWVNSSNSDSDNDDNNDTYNRNGYSNQDTQDDDLHFKADGSLDMRYTSSQEYYEEHGTIWVDSTNNDSDNDDNHDSFNTNASSNQDTSNDELHFKADGSLDMRYTSSQDYYAEHGTIWVDSSNEKDSHNAADNDANQGSSDDNLHFKKDGTLDMRYTSSKEYVEEHGTNQVPDAERNAANQEPSQSELHYKKDGTLDMRFTSSKEYVALHPEAAPQPKEKDCISPPPYANDLKVRKDGFLDMTTSANKEYANLPKDENGNILQSTVEAITFAMKHLVDKPQAAVAGDYIDDDTETETSEMDSFDFKTAAPVSYTGSNTVVRTVLDCAEHSGTKTIGVIKLYHATTKEAAESIMAEKRFRPGSGGMFGAGMYFADKKKTAIHKSAHGSDAIIVANVDMGNALIVQGPKYDLSLEQITELGCDSVLGRSSSSAKWEYVVYDPSRIEPLSIITSFKTCGIAREHDE